MRVRPRSSTCCSPDASPTPTGADSAMMPAQFRFGPSSNESTNCRAISALRRLRSAGSTRYPHSTSSFDSPGDYLLRIGQQTQEICSATTSPRVDSAVTCATGDKPLPHPSGSRRSSLSSLSVTREGGDRVASSYPGLAPGPRGACCSTTGVTTAPPSRGPSLMAACSEGRPGWTACLFRWPG